MDIGYWILDMNIIERLTALRALMKEKGVSACIVPGTDPHASEYMAEHWTEMSWITGFLGETGTYGKKRKDAIDTLSAEIILQNYIDRERNK